MTPAHDAISPRDVIGLDGRHYRKSDWLHASLKERLVYLNHNMMVPYPELVHVIEEIKRRMARCELIEKGDCILVVADTGAGKSYLVKYFTVRLPPQEHETWSERRLCAFNTPARPSYGVLSDAYLSALGAETADTGTLKDKQRRCGLNAVNTKNRLMLLDNAHRIPEKRILGVRECGDWCCDLYDAAPLLLVLLGAQPVIQITLSNEQLRRRSLAKYYLSYFDVIPLARARAYLRFLHLLDIALPLSKLCNLAIPDMMMRFLCATLGIIDLHIRLANDAVQIAVEAGQESFGLPELGRAYTQMVGDVHAAPNPFDPGFKPRLLTGPGEIFADWLKNARGRYAAGKNAKEP